MSVKPYITLLFLVSVLTVLLLISVLFPRDGINIAKGFNLKFITPDEIFKNDRNPYADISDILENNEVIDDTILANLALDEQVIEWDTVKANADSLRKSITRITFATNNKKMLYPAFKAFENASNAKKPVRVMHYGDSQIEGDRITSYLRYKLQQKFGGMGVGLMPVEQVYDFSFSVTQENSDNWYRYTLYGNRDTTVEHNRYGALAGFCRFSPYTTDSTHTEEKELEAWVSFGPSPYSYANTKKFQQCRVFYGHNSAPFVTELYQSGQLADVDMYPKSNAFNTIRWVFDQPVSDIRIVFKGTKSPEIYGVALDGISGIAVDNIAMRGSPGLIFSKMNKKTLKEHYKELNVKLIILQFGGNVVPHITHDYGYYKRLFYKQLERINELLPDIAIVVIGVADMSIKEKDRYVTYPNLENVRDAIKSATLEAGYAYWDMYEAMGGKNSMPSWVFANPSLASKDFVHFNVNGSRIIAQMFYNSLIYEYNVYKNSAGIAEVNE